MKLEKVVTGSQPLQSETYNKRNTSAISGTIEMDIKDQENKPHSEEVVKEKDVETVVSKLNKLIEPLRTNLKFEYHEKLEEYYVTVVNPITDEVIKEIPSRKMMDMYAAMAEYMGLFVDEKI